MGSGRRWTRPILGALLAGASAAVVSLAGTADTVAQAPSPSPTESPTLVDGAIVFRAHCSGCHGNSGEGALEGPSLQGIPASEASISGVVEIVRSGWGDMDPFGDELSEPEIEAVARHVVTEFGTIGELPLGGELFRLNCAGCHGAAGRGGALIYSTRNAPSLEGVANAVNVAAVRGGPGTMPAFNQAVLSDHELASITEYVAVLSRPPRPGGVAVAPPGPVTEGLLAGLIGLGAALIAAVWVTKGGRG